MNVTMNIDINKIIGLIVTVISIIGAIIGAVQGDTGSSSISANDSAQSGGTNSQPTPRPGERTPEQVRASLMRQLNEFRASQGVAPVAESAELNAIRRSGRTMRPRWASSSTAASVAGPTRIARMSTSLRSVTRPRPSMPGSARRRGTARACTTRPPLPWATASLDTPRARTRATGSSCSSGVTTTSANA